MHRTDKQKQTITDALESVLGDRFNPELSGFVYLAYNPLRNAYKIGNSINPRERVKLLNRDTKRPHFLIHSFPCANSERTRNVLRKKMGEYKIFGPSEYFRLPDEAVNWIISIKDGHMVE